MAALQNVTIKNADSGFYIDGKFNGLVYYVGMSSAGISRLHSVDVKEAPMEIELSSLTLQDSDGNDSGLTDDQEKAALLNSYVSKKGSD